MERNAARRLFAGPSPLFPLTANCSRVDVISTVFRRHIPRACPRYLPRVEISGSKRYATPPVAFVPRVVRYQAEGFHRRRAGPPLLIAANSSTLSPLLGANRHVVLPPDIAKLLPKGRLLSEVCRGDLLGSPFAAGTSGFRDPRRIKRRPTSPSWLAL